MPANWIARGTVLIQLGRHHFAFFRGYLDGLDLRQLSERYIETDVRLSGSSDLRVARTVLTWIVDQLTIAARRTGHASDIRLLRMSPEKLTVDEQADLPDLEAFREERDPHQMFSERELLELFAEEYAGASAGSDRKRRRNKRLRDRQMGVLNKLEALVDSDPCLADGVDGWLDPAIAMRLRAADIHTLRELVETIEAHGYRWYTKVPRIGIRAATYICEWLMLPETSHALGVNLSVRSIRPRKEIAASMLPALPRRVGIVPLEQFDLPDALSGAFGTNRGEHPALVITNDLEAIGTWLSSRKPDSPTFRAYRKEAERLLLWSVLEANKALSSLTVEDCIAYRDFLWHLGRETEEQWRRRFRVAQADWLGPRGIDRFSSRWRPFEGALSESSQKTALVILSSFMQWLCKQNYLKNNPFKAMPQLARRSESLDVSHSLSVEEWRGINIFLDTLDRDPKYFRLRFILALSYGTGCRLSELALLRRKDLEAISPDGQSELLWEITVTSIRGEPRRIPLSRATVIEIQSYFQCRGYRSFMDAPPDAPLITAMPETDDPTRPETPLSATRIYQILKAFFAGAAAFFEGVKPALAARYRRVSTHWLRHTFATHASMTG